MLGLQLKVHHNQAGAIFLFEKPRITDANQDAAIASHVRFGMCLIGKHSHLFHFWIISFLSQQTEAFLHSVSAACLLVVSQHINDLERRHHRTQCAAPLVPVSSCLPKSAPTSVPILQGGSAQIDRMKRSKIEGRGSKCSHRTCSSH
jgi:hypothetical protein